MTAREVVESAFAAVGKRDLEGLLAIFSEDCVFEDVPSGDVAVGRDALRAVMTEYWAGLPDYHVEEATFIEDGNRVAVEVVLSGTHEGLYLGCPPSGRSVSWRAVAIYEIDPGTDTIAREIYYYDTASLTQSLGGGSSAR